MARLEDGSKSTTCGYRTLAKDLGIIYEGRILPQQWGLYTKIFKDIRELGEIKPDEFTKRYRNDVYVVEKQKKASKLISAAWNCLVNEKSEYHWRKDVEFQAFERFDSEVTCHVCFRRRWISKFEATPVDPFEAERLRRRRQKRRLCTCTSLERVSVHENQQCSRTFSSELDKRFNHEDVVEHSKKKSKWHKPDRVIGLGETRTLSHLLPSLKSRYCPYNHPDVVYPFIVIEAKAAGNKGASFLSMQQQTASVIRTCLQLQKDLQQEKGMTYQRLVWYFAIMGEEWRIHAAVPKGPDVQIFDLWHGTVLFPEGALQLLLIVDYLCDWACEVYRMSILTCLAGGRANLHRLTPSESDISSQVSIDDVRLRQMSLDRERTRVAELTMTALARNGPNSSVDVGDVHNWQQWIKREHGSPLWSCRATLRHSNHVELKYLDLIIPQDLEMLQFLLGSCFPDLRLKEAAELLMVALQDEELSITTFVKIAGGSRGRPAHRRRDQILPIRAFVYFRSALKPEDWQISRLVIRVSCSEPGMESLATIAGVPLPINTIWSNRSNNDGECEPFLQGIHWPKFISGRQSIGLALTRRPLCLRKAVTSGVDFSHFEWTRVSPSSESKADQLGEMISRVLGTQKKAEPLSDLLTPYMEWDWCSYIVPAHAGDSDTKRGLDVFPVSNLELPTFRTQGILIKKHEESGWPETTAEFCLFVMDEDIHFDDDNKLAQLLEEAKRARAVFGVVKKQARYAHGDEAFLDQWARILRGNSSRDTIIRE